MVLDRGIVPSSSVPIMTLTCTALYPRSLLFLVVSLVISFVTVPPLIYPLQAFPVSPRTNSRCLSSLPLPRPPFGSLPGTVLQTSIYPTFFFLFSFSRFLFLFHRDELCMYLLYPSAPTSSPSIHIPYMYPWTCCALAHCSFYLYRTVYLRP